VRAGLPRELDLDPVAFGLSGDLRSDDEKIAMENRHDPRFLTPFEALCSTGSEEGSGVLADISRSGARLEDTTLRPELGSKVRLYLFVRLARPFELIGEVVRLTDSGFAITIIEASDEVQELIDDVAAAVSSA